MSSELDYVNHLGIESARFSSVLQSVATDVRVPSCPEWSADDLLWHLAEVQWFWSTIVREHLNAPPSPDLRPERPSDRIALLGFFKRTSAELVRALSEASPDDRAWTWSDDHTVGFIRRRQAHEAFIHRIDAELTAGERSSMDADLSADGVDEALRVMYGTIPTWATFTASSPGAVRLRAADTGHTWSLRAGQISGFDVTAGVSVDEPCLQVAANDPGGEMPATITGAAADLDCWLWRRPTLGPLRHEGQLSLIDQIETAISSGID